LYNFDINTRKMYVLEEMVGKKSPQRREDTKKNKRLIKTFATSRLYGEGLGTYGRFPPLESFWFSLDGILYVTLSTLSPILPFLGLYSSDI
jgi:hypothetical protein